MNLHEAGIFPSVPLGAIIGGVLCKSFGVLATIGGILMGGIAGLIAGWLYGFLIILLMAVFTVPWKAVRHIPGVFVISFEEQDYLIRAASFGMIVGIISAGIIGFVVSWLYGMLAVLISAVITAFVAVVVTQLHLARDKRQERLAD